MNVQNSLEQTRVIALPSEPHMGHELETAIKNANARGQNIILDFSLVEIMSSSTICSLMILERLLNGINRHLILCTVPESIMGIFRLVGLQGLFVFAEDEGTARDWLQRHCCLCR